MSFAILPLDITLTIGLDTDETLQKSTIDAIGRFWDAYYWINFISLWTIIPFFNYYVEVESVSIKYKLIHAIKSFCVSNLIIIAVGVVALILIIIFTNLVTWDNIYGLIISCGNLYGTLFVIFGLGYGLVKYPKSYLDNRSIKTTIAYNYYSLGTSKLEKKTMKNKIEQKYFEKCLFSKVLNEGPVLDHKDSDEIYASLERIDKEAKLVLSES